MRIHLERSGGFAGMLVSTPLDTADLPADEAQALREMIHQAGFFELPENLAAEAGGADRFLYTLMVESEGQQHTVQVGEISAPPELQPLLRKLTMMARGQG